MPNLNWKESHMVSHYLEITGSSTVRDEKLYQVKITDDSGKKSNIKNIRIPLHGDTDFEQAVALHRHTQGVVDSISEDSILKIRNLEGIEAYFAFQELITLEDKNNESNLSLPQSLQRNHQYLSSKHIVRVT